MLMLRLVQTEEITILCHQDPSLGLRPDEILCVGCPEEARLGCS